MGVDKFLDAGFELRDAAVGAARICFMVSSANHRSTRLSHDPYVGVKCTWNRGRLRNQLRINAVLWGL